MSGIEPSDPTLLTDRDVDYGRFSCCGDEDLVFLRCRECGHIWVECYECSTWFVDLADTDLKESSLLTDDHQRNRCPGCGHPFADLHYLEPESCDQYLATEDQVVAAGWAEFLAPERRQMLARRATAKVADAQGRSAPGQSAQGQGSRPVRVRVRYQPNTGALLGSTIGAAGWIIGITIKLVQLGFQTEALVTTTLAAAVIAVGILLLIWARRGVVINLFQALFWLLVASFLCGLAGIIYLQLRDAWSPLVDPDGRFPVVYDYLAPFILLVMLGVLCSRPVRSYLSCYRV